MQQSRLESLIEAVVNTAIGFILSLAFAPLIYPLFGHSFTFVQNIGITIFFTGISIVRGYATRRWFNARIRAAAHRVAAAVS